VSRRNLVSLVVLLSVLCTLLMVRLNPVRADFATSNHDWNGLSDFAAATDRTLPSLDEIEHVPLPATLILVEPSGCDTADLEQLHTFVQSGGTVILMEDWDPVVDLLNAMRVDIAIAGMPLRDPLHCLRDPSLPRAYPVSSNDKMYQVVLNHASWLILGERADVLLESSFFAYGDVNGNGRYDNGEPTGPIPVAAVAPTGQGHVIVVSDASFILNGMLDVSNNMEWLASQCEGSLYLYTSSTSMPLQSRMLESLESLLASPAGVAMAAVVVLGIATLYAWYNRERHYG